MFIKRSSTWVLLSVIAL